MLRARIVPCLLVHNKGLVKTIRFSQPKYVGDPLNAVKIFNEKQVDELIVLDIDATRMGAEPQYELIQKLAMECRMPFCYGGGIRNPEQAVRIINLGVEKVALSASAISDPGVISSIARVVGRQSVVVVLDVKRVSEGAYVLCTHNGTKQYPIDPITFARQAEENGAGEIVVNSIDRDGTMQGYDLPLLERVREAVNLPLTALGGAGSYDDLRALIRKFGIVGAAAGSLFVFKGVYKAVLINYPSTSDVAEICTLGQT